MIVYRIAKKKWIKDLSGTGAKITGGRWNPKGFPVLYCASTSSLAILEKLVHVDFDLLPNDLYIAEIEIPDNSIQKLRLKDLPKDWNKYPAPDKIKFLGKDWIMANKYLILQVPSAVNPNEMNFLINVDHPDSGKIKIRKNYPFEIDDRLIK
ncbi:RES domain-containing protein [Salegentibacter holothuriorum]|uniref:RES domain-containing protein n=1 Tax=Salegentibacter holothuriorum TaxID=241145 RepID=A0A1T5AWT3_9FLAO|nr:RES domain-containing protein [Salegentibacter holothuriorum]SKB39448.1 RES domain-containing protein [Salegentibacter holothuriorum]